MRSPKPSKNLRVVLSSSHMTSVCPVHIAFMVTWLKESKSLVGLIGQVAEELWEVANKKIRNLTKEEISIQDYKKNLVKQSACSNSNHLEYANLTRVKVMPPSKRPNCSARLRQRERHRRPQHLECRVTVSMSILSRILMVTTFAHTTHTFHCLFHAYYRMSASFVLRNIRIS